MLAEAQKHRHYLCGFSYKAAKLCFVLWIILTMIYLVCCGMALVGVTRNGAPLISMAPYLGRHKKPTFAKQASTMTSERWQNTENNMSTLGIQNKQISFLEKTLVPAVFLKDVNCAALLRNDATEIDKAKRIHRELPSDISFVNRTENCQEFIQQREYSMKPVTEEEAAFPIAYSILMFKDVAQVERLLRAIYRPQNVYCVHVDRKSPDDVFRGIASVVRCLPNVFLTGTRYDVQWGLWSVLEPDLECMRQLWDNPIKWKYLINLTGQEFPLKTNHQLVKILQAFRGANSLEGTKKRKNIERTEYKWVNGEITTTSLGPAPHNITVTKGSVHIVVQRAFVDFILHNKIAHDFLAWANNTGIPDETVFSSLNYSPQVGVPGAYKGVPETDLNSNPFLARFKNWQYGLQSIPCRGQFVRQVCVFGVGDLQVLAKRKELFANKFYPDYQPVTLDCMEELHFNRTRRELGGNIKFDTKYYASRDFVKRHV